MASEDHNQLQNINGDKQPHNMNLMELSKVVGASSEPKQQLAAIKAARELHLMDNNDLMKSNIIPALVGCLKNDKVEIQFEAACALINITAGSSEQRTQVVAAGAVPLLIQLLSSPEPSVCEHAAWAIANLIVDGPKLRDYTIQHGVVRPLISLIHLDTPTSILFMVTCAFTNICCYKDPPLPAATIREILPALNVLIRYTNTDVLIGAIRAICVLTTGGNDQIQMIIKSGVVKKLVTLLGHTDVNVQKAAIHALGNIVSGTNEQKQVVINCEALSYFPVLLTHDMDIIREDAVWFLSNIAAGNQTQVESVIDRFFPRIIEILHKDGPQVQMQAAVLIGNLIGGLNLDGIFALIRRGIMPPFCDSLACEKSDVIRNVLTALNDMLIKAGQHVEVIAKLIHECDGLRKIERLQYHECLDIYKLAKKILCTYFSDKVQPTELSCNQKQPAKHANLDRIRTIYQITNKNFKNV